LSAGTEKTANVSLPPPKVPTAWSATSQERKSNDFSNTNIKALPAVEVNWVVALTETDKLSDVVENLKDLSTGLRSTKTLPDQTYLIKGNISSPPSGPIVWWGGVDILVVYIGKSNSLFLKTKEPTDVVLFLYEESIGSGYTPALKIGTVTTLVVFTPFSSKKEISEFVLSI